MVFVNKKEVDNKVLMVIFDEELYGKTFEDEKAIINLNSRFYESSEKIPEEEVKQILKEEEIYLVEFIGEKSIKIGKELDMIDEIKTIDKISYSFALLGREKRR